MELLVQFQDITLYGVLLAFVFCLLGAVSIAKRTKNKGKRLPEAPGGWPIIGHLHHLLGANTLVHRKLSVLSNECGPISSIRLGPHRALIVDTYEIAKEIFTANDKNFSSRPRSLALKIMAYDHAVLGFAPYGPYWRDMRKVAMVELLSNKQLRLHEPVRDIETKLLVKELYSQCVKNGGQAVVEMNEMFGKAGMNIIVRQLAGKRYIGSNLNNDGGSRRCQKAMGDYFYWLGVFMFSDAVPLLGWVDYVRGYIGEMKKTALEIDSVLQSWLDEHRQQRLSKSINEEEQDFIHVMLSAVDDGRISIHDSDAVIKAICLSLLLGGNDTNVITLTWTLSLLLNNKLVLEKAQDELDNKVGKDRQVEESDIKNLPYLQAIVKETLRLYPALPLSVHRETMEDCTIGGFYVPANTRVLLNIWKLQRDPRIWQDPLEFKPERFLEENVDIDVKGKDYELLPFGSGRRMCPGMTYALQVQNLTMARLLQGFELGRVHNEPVDMTEAPGLTLPKATPLEVVLTPRLPSALYV